MPRRPLLITSSSTDARNLEAERKFGEDSIQYFHLLYPSSMCIRNENQCVIRYKMSGNVVKWPVRQRKTNSRLLQCAQEVRRSFMPGRTTLLSWFCQKVIGGGGGRIFALSLGILPPSKVRSQLINWFTGVGFKIGEGSKINYLVLQVHYADVKRFVSKWKITTRRCYCFLCLH